jgi:hypothetical protein
MFRIAILFVTWFVFVATSAQAYIGPGLGAGVIGTIIGVLGSIFLALFAVFYYPVKRMIRRRRMTRETGAVAKPDTRPSP